jgi:hypothetical protein
MAEAKSEGTGSGKSTAETVQSVRTGVATVLWLLAVLAAVLLAIGTLVVALDFDEKNAIVNFFRQTAENIDFGAFKTFEPDGKGEAARHSALVKTVLVSWGTAALIYLVVGKILDRVIRP